MMGKSAPEGYLACDGMEYNIADYPSLAAYFEEQFDSSNYFGGDGVDTFAVPDLRGEFLRGTGANSHTNTTLGRLEGSGLAVGVHQEATVLPNNYTSATPTMVMRKISKTETTGIYNFDAGLNSTMYSAASASTTTNGSNNLAKFTVRPTNTAVLYCIKT